MDESANDITIQRFAITFCNLLSMASATYLIAVSLRSSRRKRLLVQQIASLSLSDLALGLVCVVVPAAERGEYLYPGDPPWCGPYMLLQRWLQLQSVLFSATIPLSVLAALLRLPKALERLRWAALLVLPLAAAMNAAYVALPAVYATDLPLPYCKSEPLAERIFAAELMGFFVFVSVVLWWAVCRLRTTSPDSVAARSLRGSRRYMLAFLFSWALYVGSVLREWMFGKNVRSSSFWILHIVRQAAASLNGFMNFLAFIAERREALTHRRSLNAVVFNSNVSDHTVSVAPSVAQPTEGCYEDEDESDEEDYWTWLGYDDVEEAPTSSRSCSSMEDPLQRERSSVQLGTHTGNSPS